MKDRSKLRRYIMHKLHVEFDELKEKIAGKLFLKEIIVCI